MTTTLATIAYNPKGFLAHFDDWNADLAAEGGTGPEHFVTTYAHASHGKAESAPLSERWSIIG